MRIPFRLLAAAAGAALLAACTSHHHAPHAPVEPSEEAGDLPRLTAGLIHEEGEWRVVDVGDDAARGVKVDLAARRPLVGYPCIHTDVGNWNPLFIALGTLGEGDNIFADEGYCNLDVTCSEPWCHPELVTTRWRAPGAADPRYWAEEGAGSMPGTLVFTPVETALDAVGTTFLGYCSEVDCLDPGKFRRALAAGLDNAGLDLSSLLADYRRLLSNPDGVRLTSNLEAWASLLAQRPDLGRRQFTLTLSSANFLVAGEVTPRDGTFRARPSPEPLEREPGRARFRLQTRHFPDHCRVRARVAFSVSQEVAFPRRGEREPVRETLWVGEGDCTFELSPANEWQEERQVSFGPILLREPGHAGVGAQETRSFAIDSRIESVRLACDPAGGS